VYSVGFADMPLVSISQAQREPIAKANPWEGRGEL
jgi:hypothetical protein